MLNVFAVKELLQDRSPNEHDVKKIKVTFETYGHQRNCRTMLQHTAYNVTEALETLGLHFVRWNPVAVEEWIRSSQCLFQNLAGQKEES